MAMLSGMCKVVAAGAMGNNRPWIRLRPIALDPGCSGTGLPSVKEYTPTNSTLDRAFLAISIAAVTSDQQVWAQYDPDKIDENKMALLNMIGVTRWPNPSETEVPD